MRIISIWHGFTSDHSSTSYEFAAIDKPLGKEARNRVSSRSSRANPTKRTVKFVYNVEGYDIPGGWEPLMRDYYDVMWTESYDWWTLAVAFDAPKEQQEEIQEYAFDGDEYLSVDVSTVECRVIVSIGCKLDVGALYDLRRYDYDEDDDEAEDIAYEPEDPLLNLLAQIRKQLINRDYRALYIIWKDFLVEDEADVEGEMPPEPQEQPTGGLIVERFRNLLLASD